MACGTARSPAARGGGPPLLCWRFGGHWPAAYTPQSLNILAESLTRAQSGRICWTQPLCSEKICVHMLIVYFRARTRGAGLWWELIRMRVSIALCRRYSTLMSSRTCPIIVISRAASVLGCTSGHDPHAAGPLRRVLPLCFAALVLVPQSSHILAAARVALHALEPPERNHLVPFSCPCTSSQPSACACAADTQCRLRLI